MLADDGAFRVDAAPVARPLLSAEQTDVAQGIVDGFADVFRGIFRLGAQCQFTWSDRDAVKFFSEGTKSGISTLAYFLKDVVNRVALSKRRHCPAFEPCQFFGISGFFRAENGES